jgi:hypothetical protein
MKTKLLQSEIVRKELNCLSQVYIYHRLLGDGSIKFYKLVREAAKDLKADI